MKIAIVTTYQKCVGGVQVFTRDISNILRQRGHQVRIFSPESLNEIPESDLERVVGEHFNHLNEDEGFDVVLCNGEFGFSVEHPNAINVFHGNYYGYAMAMKDMVPEEVTLKRLFKAEMQKKSAERKYVVTVSESSKRQLEDFGIYVDEVVKNSVNTNLFYPRDDVQRGIHALALSRGRYYEKGFDVLKRLAEKGVRMRLFSDKTIDAPNVDNNEIIENEELCSEYNKAEVLLFPSRFEGGSLIVLEAMACGCPVITTPTGYGYEVQREIPNFVAETFDEFMAKYLLVRNEREKYSKQAINYFWQNHSPEVFKKRWIDIVES